MTERERPDLDAVAKRFEDNGEVRSDSENTARHRQDVRKDRRRGGTIKRGLKKAGVGLGILGVGTAGGAEALHHMDGKPLGRTATAPKVGSRIPGRKPAAERPAPAPAPQSGVIQVDNGETSGYVDLNNPNPEDTTTVESPQTGGVGLDTEQTGGISPDSTN